MRGRAAALRHRAGTGHQPQLRRRRDRRHVLPAGGRPSAQVAGLPIDTVRDLLKAGVGPRGSRSTGAPRGPRSRAFQQKLREGLNQPYGVINLNGLIRTGPAGLHERPPTARWSSRPVPPGDPGGLLGLERPRPAHPRGRATTRRSGAMTRAAGRQPRRRLQVAGRDVRPRTADGVQRARSGVPMETNQPPEAPRCGRPRGRGSATGRWLPNGNPGGYLWRSRRCC